MCVNFTIARGSILDAQVEGIVNPANSLGRMGGGVAGVIRRAAGKDVEREAMATAPIPIGKAVITSGGATGFKAVIHAPTMVRPREKIPVENVGQATGAALVAADAHGLASIAIPGMGTGTGRISPTSAAEAMVRAIRDFRPAHIREVLLVDVDERMVAAWRRAALTAQSEDST